MILHLHVTLYVLSLACTSAWRRYASFTLDALDGKHAKNTKNDSPLGEFVSYGCQNLGAVRGHREDGVCSPPRRNASASFHAVVSSDPNRKSVLSSRDTISGSSSF